MEIFIGKTVRSEPLALKRTPASRSPMPGWPSSTPAAMPNCKRLQPIAGAVDAVRAVHALLGGRIACASGADRQKVEMQLAQVGLASYFGDRVFSGHEMPAPSPRLMCTWPPPPR